MAYGQSDRWIDQPEWLTRVTGGDEASQLAYGGLLNALRGQGQNPQSMANINRLGSVDRSLAGPQTPQVANASARYQNLSNAIAGKQAQTRMLQDASLYQQGFGQAGQQQTQWDREYQNQLQALAKAKKKARGKRYGAIAGAIGAIVAGVFTGGAGAGAGYAAGSAIGEGLAG